MYYGADIESRSMSSCNLGCVAGDGKRRRETEREKQGQMYLEHAHPPPPGLHGDHHAPVPLPSGPAGPGDPPRMSGQGEHTLARCLESCDSPSSQTCQHQQGRSALPPPPPPSLVWFFTSFPIHTRTPPSFLSTFSGGKKNQ